VFTGFYLPPGIGVKGQAESPAPNIAGSNVSLEDVQPAMLDDASKHEDKEKATEAQKRLEDDTKDVTVPNVTMAIVRPKIRRR
jgi:hypothetical protein